jgi:hypothetical protein
MMDSVQASTDTLRTVLDAFNAHDLDRQEGLLLEDQGNEKLSARLGEMDAASPQEHARSKVVEPRDRGRRHVSYRV